MSYAVVADADAAEEAMGRALADDIGKAYPMPPDIVGPGLYPCGLTEWTAYEDLTPEQQAACPKQSRAVCALRVEGDSGGLIVVDSFVREKLAPVEVEAKDVPAKYRPAIEVAAVEAAE